MKGRVWVNLCKKGITILNVFLKTLEEELSIGKELEHQPFSSHLDENGTLVLLPIGTSILDQRMKSRLGLPIPLLPGTLPFMA